MGLPIWKNSKSFMPTDVPPADKQSSWNAFKLDRRVCDSAPRSASPQRSHKTIQKGQLSEAYFLSHLRIPYGVIIRSLPI